MGGGAGGGAGAGAQASASTSASAAAARSTPPLIDLQINGHSGIDFSSASLTVAQFEKACQAVFDSGTAAFLPTVRKEEDSSAIRESVNHAHSTWMHPTKPRSSHHRLRSTTMSYRSSLVSLNAVRLVVASSAYT